MKTFTPFTYASLFIYFMLLSINNMHAQNDLSPHIIKFINEFSSGSSSPQSLTNVNGVLYFSAINAAAGRELWKSDGTITGTVMVKDINSGTEDSSPASLMNVNGILYFRADNGIAGNELWKSDGTEAGTVMVKDIHLGIGNSNPQSLANVNGILYFTANNGITGSELWKSDGTEAGTVMVKDINPGTSSSYPIYLTNVNGVLYFRADNDTAGRELWKSDGTEAGTVMIKDINLGTADSSPTYLTNFNGILYFRAYDGTAGSELWKSDGTETGTVMVKDISLGTVSSSPSHLTNFNGFLYFGANDGTGNGLWKSDGTELGTAMVKDISPSYLTNVNGVLYFAANDGMTNGLWKSDGTEAGTVMVKDVNPDYLTNVNGLLYFRVNDAITGRELWKSDGTEAGTVMIKDIHSTYGSTPSYLTNINGVLYFSADNGTAGRELWKSDGTEAGTVIVKDIYINHNGSSPSNLTDVNGVLYFLTNGRTELWKSDGTVAGTVMVKDVLTVYGNYTADYLTNVNGVLYFRTYDSTAGYELWKSDGTEAGTVMVKDIRPGMDGTPSPDPNSSYPNSLTDVNGVLYFRAYDGTTSGLWKSDGTAAGTVMIKDIYSYTFPDFTNVNGVLYFTANNGTAGNELWKSDGTTAGTVMVKDIYPGIGSNYNARYLTDVNGVLYFVVNDGTAGTELWKSDGTMTGTIMVKDIRPGASSSSPNNLTNVNGVLYFSASDGTVGSELWKSDGTEAGTVMVKDIYSGTASSSFAYLTNVNGVLYFRANDGTVGSELWKSDGTEAGTVMVKDILPGTGNSSPSYLTNVNGNLYFSASSDGTTNSLWKSDGTAAGTVIVNDISVSNNLTNVNNVLYFTGQASHNDIIYGSSGTVLFKLGECSPSSPLATTIVNAGKPNTLSFNNQIQAGNPNQTCRCDIFNKLIETTDAEGANPVSGDISTRLWIDNAQDPLHVKRHYQIIPAIDTSTATGKVTLYFTQEEFNDFNAANATKLPTGSGDAAGIANILVEKRPGSSSDGSGDLSSYPDGIDIDPDDSDIVWNATGNRWEITINVTGFGGFWLKTASTCAISNVALSADGSCNSLGATFDISFDVSDGSGNYEVFNTTDNTVLGTLTAANYGTGLIISGLVPGSTTADIINMDVRDSGNSSCLGGVPLTVNIPTCDICDISNLALSANGSCGGPGVVFEISFDVSDGSGNYELFNTANNMVLGTLTSAGTAGTGLIISGWQTGPTTVGTINVNVRDSGDLSCLGAADVTVTIPACSPPIFKWDGEAGDGLWITPLNWTTNVAPTASDDAIIDIDETVTVSSDAFAKSITMSNGGDLIVSASNTLTISTVTNSATGHAVTVGTTCVLTNNGTILISNSVNDGIRNFGIVNNSANSDISITNTGGLGFANGTDHILNNDGTVTIMNSGAAGINNDGTVTNSTTGNISITNAGDFGFHNASTNVIFDNSGIVTILNSSNDGIRNLGTVTNFATGDISITDAGYWGFANSSDDIFNNSGTVSIINSTDNGIYNDGTITNSATGDISITDAGNYGFANAFSNDIFNNSGIVSITNSTNNGIYNVGTVTNASSGNISITDAGNLGFYNLSSFNNDGTVSILSSIDSGIYNEGTVTNAATGNISITDVTYYGFENRADDIFNNSGIVSITNSTNNGIYNEGTITNFSTGDISITNAGNYGIYNVASSDILTNSGTVSITNSVDDGIYNHGTVDNTDGILEMNGSMYGISSLAGTLAPGNSVGQTDNNGNLTLTGTLEIEVDNLSTFDLLNSTNSGTLDLSIATIDFVFAGTSTDYTVGDKFQIINGFTTVTSVNTISNNLGFTITDNGGGEFEITDGAIVVVQSNCLDFGNTNDYVSIGNLGTVTDWTIELWFKPNGGINYQNLFHSDDTNLNQGVRLETSSDVGTGHLYASVSGADNFTPHTIIPLAGSLSTNWQHLAIVGDQTNNKIIIYHNGNQVINATHTDWPTSFPNFALGRGYNTDADRNYSGQLDEFRIWSDVRTAAEISANKDNEITANEDDLMAYYRFNQGNSNGNNATVSTLDDLTCNAPGTLTDFTLSGSTSNWTESTIPLGESPWTQLGLDIDGEAINDVLGYSVSLSSDGNTMAVGANGNDDNGNRAGHTKIYDWNGSSWEQRGSNINGEAAEDESGYSVSLSSDGTRVAIGAFENDGNGSNSGHCRIYEWNTTNWIQMGGDINGEATSDLSAGSVSLSSDGTRVAIGADLNDGNGSNSGHCRIYEWNATNWIQMGGDINGEATDDWSGRSVSLSSDGTRVAIGALGNDGNGSNSGHCRIYEWNATNWVQMGGDINGETANDFSGRSVSLSSDGTTVAIGSRENDANGTDAGHVRVYDWNGSNWTQRGPDIDGEAAGDQSGTSVSLSADGNRVTIGAPANDGNGSNAGHVRIYDWDSSNNIWVQHAADIDGESADDQSGKSISISADGNTLAIGAWLNDATGTDAGHVRVYRPSFACTTTTSSNSNLFVDKDATGLNNGTSWANAYINLQSALDIANTGDEIWVAEGTYFPSKDPFGSTSPTDPRDKTFYLPDGIKIYGGFAATETLLSERDIPNNETILSGDIGVAADNTDNSYHVVLASADASTGIGVTVDGFSITAGNADLSSTISVNGKTVYRRDGGGIYTSYGTNSLNNNTIHNNSANRNGGGIFTFSGTNSLSNNTIHNNSAEDGGGIYTSSGTTTLSNNTIHNNSADYGGGIRTHYATNSLNNNTIRDNSAVTDGGGIYTFSGTNSLNNNTIHNNSANYGGGGIYIADNNTDSLNNNIIYNNSAGSGGGIYTAGGTNSLNNNIIHNNSVIANGGGIFTNSGINSLNSNTIHTNSAIANGGGIYTNSGTNSLNNNAIHNNSANYGSGIYTFLGTNSINNNTVHNNSAATFGGGIFTNTSTDTLTNNIFWDNKQASSNNVAGADIYNNNSTLTVEYCLTQENSTYSTGTGIINNQDPLFVDAADPDGADDISGTADDGLALSVCSNLVDAGITTTPPLPNDILGNARVGGYYDIGAYESQTACSCAISNVALSMDGSCNGLNADFSISFNVSDGSGNYEVFNTADNTVLGTLTSASTSGTGLIIPGSLTGPTSAGTINVDIRDSGNLSCLGASPVTVNIPTCQPCAISNVALSMDGSCNGLNANFNISFDVSDGSGNYEVFNTANNIVLGTLTSAATSGTGLIISGSTTGPTTTSTINVDVRDSGNLSCLGASPVTVNIPTCPAEIQNALNFDGVNDGVSLNTVMLSPSNANQAYTIEAWIKAPPQGNNCIVCQHNYPNGTNRFQLMIANHKLTWIKSLSSSDAEITSTLSIDDNQWHHVAGTRDSDGNVKLYIDGVLDGTGIDNAPFLNTNTSIGEKIPLNNGNFEGNIDEVRIWNVAHTQEQIECTRNIELLGNESSLIAYYDFNQGDAGMNNTGETVLLDRQTNTSANNGTLNSFALNGSTSNWVKSTIFLPVDLSESAWPQLGADIDGEATGDQFGYSVSLSSDGNTMAVGGRLNDGTGTDAGHARVYDWNGNSWLQRGADINGEAAADLYGSSISLSSDGNTVAISARNNGNGYHAGHVRVHDWDGSAWVQRGADLDGQQAGDWFGFSISLSSNGNTVAIGASGNDGNGSNTGRVWVYDWDNNINSWVERNTINGEAVGDYSGWAVSLSSDANTVAIGARDNDGNGSNSGHVRIYDWDGSAWIKRGADIDGEAANDWSGTSLSLSSDGNTVAIGARRNDGNGSNSGHVRVHDWNGSSWIKRGADIDGEAASDESSTSISLSSDGNIVAIGASGNDGNGSGSGHVRVYNWNGSSWVLFGMEIDGEAAGDLSGSGGSVSLSSDGNTLAIGAHKNDGNGTDAGHARVYRFACAINNVAISIDGSCDGLDAVFDISFDVSLGSGNYEVFNAADNTVLGTFSSAVSNGNGIVISCLLTGATTAGTINVDVRDSGDLSCSGGVPVTVNIPTCDIITQEWGQLGLDIDGEASSDLSGYAVSMSSDGNTVAIGARLNDGNGIDAGQVRIYDWDNSSWNQRGADINGEAAGDESGFSLSLSSDGNTVAIGAHKNGGTDAGHVRIYDWNGSSWTQRGVDINGEAANDQFGYSVSLSSDGNIVAIGGRLNNSNGTDAGHVRIYEWNGSAWLIRGLEINGEGVDDWFGFSIALSSDGNTVAVGAVNNNDAGGDAGHVQIYDWNGSSWLQRGMDINGEAANDRSGYWVSLSDDGNTLAIGARGNTGSAGYVKVYDWDCSLWVLRGARIDGEAVGDQSGISVSLSADGNTLAIGAHLNDEAATDAGHVRVYDWYGSWVQRGMNIDGEAAADQFGRAVSLSSDGKTVAIGALRNDGTAAEAGHVRVYRSHATDVRLFVDKDATGLGNGTSWTDAFTDLQSAIDVANTGDEIWVAEGTYLPTDAPDGTTSTGATDRNNTFHFNKDIKIYGGFAATETLLTERDAVANPTILSGDFNADDVVTGSGSTLTFANNTENAYHVMITANLTADAIIDGFTFEGGNASGSSSISYNSNNFDRNKAGGIYNNNSSITISNCSISNNNANNGGGMLNDNNSSPTINNTSFSNNAAANNGGGMYNNNDSPIISNCSFSGNTTVFSGGGIYNRSEAPAISNPTISNCYFSNNSANNGGGMYNLNSSPTTNNCSFSNNNATYGGGIYNSASSSPLLQNTVLFGNSTGAAINDLGGSGSINVASSNNASDGTGGDINTGTGFISLTVSPFIDDTDSDGADDIPMTADDGLALSVCSNLIDAGTSTPALDNDILGNARVGNYDIGAYEHQNPASVEITVKMFLEGSYSSGTGLMGDNLRSAGLVPLDEPYAAMSVFNHVDNCKTETTTAPVLAVTGNDAIVDWIFLELRDKSAAATIIATRAALLQKDGDVVDLDGVSAVTFAGIAADDYYIAIRHRNHLGTMTLNTVALTSSATQVIDFTNPATLTYGTDAQANISGVMCLRGGNTDSNSFIRATGPSFINDASQILNRLGAFTNVESSVYETYDINMDGTIRATGPSFINDASKLLNYLGNFTTIRTEQLP